MVKKYKLLKDIPQCKAGTIFTKYAEDAIDYVGENVTQWNSGKCKYEKIFLLDCHVERCHDFFEEIIPEEQPATEFIWTDDLAFRWLIYFSDAGKTNREKNGEQLLADFKKENSTPISQLQKEKLFTTEDGVDVFHGDAYCFLYNKGTFIHKVRASLPNTPADYEGEDVKKFSTEAAAKEYIDKQKNKVDWEIVSFKTKHELEGVLIHRNTSGLFNSELNFNNWDENRLINLGYSIHSVRVPSNGKVFKIRDYVGYDNGNIRTDKSWEVDNFIIRESDGQLLARSKNNFLVASVDKWLYKDDPQSSAQPSAPIENTDKKENLSDVTIYKYSTGYSLMSFPTKLLDEHVEKIKSVVQSVLNNEPLYTEKEMLAIEHRAFVGAKVRVPSKYPFSSPMGGYKYPTFSDYKNQSK